MRKLGKSQITRCVNYYEICLFNFFSTYIKMSNPREITKEVERQAELKLERIK